MAQLKAFKGIRPVQELVKRVACRPYDVLNEKEARIEANGDKISFYHVIKPEIDSPDGYNVYSPEIYEKGRDNFAAMRAEGVFKQDETDCLYIYSQTMNGRTQYGIVGCASVDDYLNDVIKKHELTRPDKEEDRKNHVRVSGNMNAEPVFFAYPHVAALDAIVAEVIKATPAYDMVTDDGIGHTFWVISDAKTVNDIITLFAKSSEYVCCRWTSSHGCGCFRRTELRKLNPNHTGQESYNFFLAVHFPDNQLHIMDYNRVIKDLNGHSASDILEKLKENFEITEKGS